MRIRRTGIGLLFVLAITIVASLLPQVAYAQCGAVGQPPCPPGGGKKKPTLLPPKSTATPTADVTLTTYALTYLPCYATIFPHTYETAAAALTQTLDDWSYWAETTADVAVNRCMTGTPSPVFIPPVAGPVYVLPGVKNVLILVLLIGVLSGGLFLILRGFRPPNPNEPPNQKKEK